MKAIHIMGHRGAMADRIENTIPSFHEALRQGATGLEMDIRRAASGELVVFHDNDLQRLGGIPQRVEEMNVLDLQSVVLSQPQFEPQTAAIPTLHQVVTDPFITSYLARDLVLSLEIKSHDIEDLLVSSVYAWGLEHQVVIYSFDLEQLLNVQALAPELPTNLLFGGEREKNMKQAAANGISMINPEPYDVTPDFVDQARALGLLVSIGRTNDYEEMLRLLDLDVWGIHTDRPQLLVEAKREKGLSGPVGQR